MNVYNLILTFEDGSIMPYVYSSQELTLDAQEISCEIHEDVVSWALVESELDHKFLPDTVH